MRMTAKAMSLQLGVLDVSALAVKAADLPNRFGRPNAPLPPPAAIVPVAWAFLHLRRAHGVVEAGGAGSPYSG